jgi:excisionase family DNA binding protein
MQQISLLTKEDVKAAVREALSETQPQQPTNQDTIIYGLQGLADYLGVGVTTAWKLKKSGAIPFYQAGKKVFFKESEVLTATSKK